MRTRSAIFLLSAVLLLSAALLLSSAPLQLSYSPNLGIRGPPDAFSPIQAPPTTLKEAQGHVNFTIATIRDLSKLPEGTQLLGVYVDPPTVSNTGVSLVYWRGSIVPGQTRWVEVFAQGGAVLHEESWKADDAKQALQQFLDLFVGQPLPSNMKTFEVDGYPYLLGPFGLTWWRNNILFTLILGDYPRLDPSAHFLRDTMTSTDMVAIAQSVQQD